MKQFALALFLSGILGVSQAGNSWNPVRQKPFEDLRKPIVLKLSPFHFFDRQLSLTGDFFNKDFKRSTAVTLNLIYADNSSIYDVGTSVFIERKFFPRGFQVDTSSFNRNSASGFYFGLGVQGGYSEFIERDMYPYDSMGNLLKFSDSDIKITSMWVAPMVSVGYQFILWDALYLDAFVGGGIKFNDTQKNENYAKYFNNPNIFSRYYKGIMPRVGITLGIGL